MAVNAQQTQTGVSEDMRTLITVLLLIFIYPVGLIVMFLWTRWKMWVKLLVASPLLLGILALVAAIILVAMNPAAQLKKGECLKLCQNGDSVCINRCLQGN